MIEEAQTVIQAGRVLILACRSYRFVHGGESLIDTTEIGLEYGHIKWGILVRGFVRVVFVVVVVLMKVFKR